jgi:hypothetical protein
MPAGDPFGDVMNAPKKYVVSKTLERPQASVSSARCRASGTSAYIAARPPVADGEPAGHHYPTRRMGRVRRILVPSPSPP